MGAEMGHMECCLVVRPMQNVGIGLCRYFYFVHHLLQETTGTKGEYNT